MKKWKHWILLRNHRGPEPTLGPLERVPVKQNNLLNDLLNSGEKLMYSEC